jgi:hypothetical protein
MIFSGEYEGLKWRKALSLKAADKANKGKNIKKVIFESLEVMRELNPEAL